MQQRSLPLFPLNAVLFPGVTLPLHVFEDRYRALVRDLLAVPDPAERLFGSVAIREGYEVGEHGAQSLYRVGCVLQVTEVERAPDGTFELEAVVRGRIRLRTIERDGEYPVAEADLLSEGEEQVDVRLVQQAREAFLAYADELAGLRGEPLIGGSLPHDPVYLSWAVSAAALLPLQDQQSLLEAPDATERLALVTHLIGEERRAMTALPSLPAVRVARTAWSPN